MKMLKGIYVKNRLFFKFKNEKKLILPNLDIFIPFNQLIHKEKMFNHK